MVDLHCVNYLYSKVSQLYIHIPYFFFFLVLFSSQDLQKLRVTQCMFLLGPNQVNIYLLF